MAQICGKRLQYIRNGFTVLEMASQFEKRLIYVGNEVFLCDVACVFEKLLKMWNMTQKYGKRLKYVGKFLRYLTNALNVWELAQVCGKWLKYVGKNGLSIEETA